MLVLKIFGIFLVICLIFNGISELNKSCKEKFNRSFISAEVIGFQLVVGTLIFVGKSWYKSALTNNGDILNGQLLIGLGIISGIGYIIHLYKTTNFLYGFIGMIIILMFLALYIYVGIYFVIFYIFASIVTSIAAKPTRIIK